MSASVFVRRFVFGLKKGQIFTTKDVLRFGTRKAVDCALNRLVKKGHIIRLTSGVFLHGDEMTKLPSAMEVAVIKAKAFGKKVTIHGNDAAQQLQLMQTSDDEDSLNLWIDGSSSSFKYGNVKINFQSVCKRKMRLAKKGGPGLSLAALWHIGKRKVTRAEIQRSLPNNSLERAKLKTKLENVPQWLSQFYLK